ncbi:MAG: preprotein translocase subunit SecG, partial [Bacteroidaceae bacterium]|nr:preprotein translocase subunit SecG [Bacteroidaceae bacterium]
SVLENVATEQPQTNPNNLPGFGASQTQQAAPAANDAKQAAPAANDAKQAAPAKEAAPAAPAKK